MPLHVLAIGSIVDGMTQATSLLTTAIPPADAARTIHHPDPTMIRRAIARRSVAVLATASPAGRPHAATVLYQFVDDVIYVSTDSGSRKARNVADCGRAAIAITVRRLPVGPPATIHLQSTATVLSTDHPEIVRLAAAGRLQRITSHGELQLDGGCFLRIPLPDRLITYALGMSLWTVMRHPLDIAGEVHLRRAGRPPS